MPVMKTKGRGPIVTMSRPRRSGSEWGNKESEKVDSPSLYKISTRNEELPGKGYDYVAFRLVMNSTADRCKQIMLQMIGMHGRADPALLDPVRIRKPEAKKGEEYFLWEVAAVSTRDGEITVNVYDKDMTKDVERAIYRARIGLSPQHMPDYGEGGGVLRIPIPRPTAETRTHLLKRLHRVYLKARELIRAQRHSARLKINRDKFNQNDSHRDMSQMDKEARLKQREIDEFYSAHRKRIEEEIDS